MLERLGIGAEIDHLHDIFAADLTPKPELHGYRKLLDQFGIEPANAVMVEDMVRNLAPAKQLGMTTVWVDNGLRARQSRLQGSQRRLSRHRCGRLARSPFWGTSNE